MIITIFFDDKNYTVIIVLENVPERSRSGFTSSVSTWIIAQARRYVVNTAVGISKIGVLFLICGMMTNTGYGAMKVARKELSHTSIEWLNDYQEACRRSKQHDLPMVLFFTGVDWSGSCMKMRQEVLDSHAFIQHTADRFVHVELVFPKYHQLADAVRDQNQRLSDELKVDEFPCIVILSPDGREIYRITSFGQENGDSLGKFLCRVIEEDAFLCSVQDDLSLLSLADLKRCYHTAQELSRKELLGAIIDQGAASGDQFFLLEKFRFLVERGRMGSDECVEIKKQLLTKDPKNENQTHFAVALIEFQELSRQAKAGEVTDMTKVIRPLEQYLQHFGKKDVANAWRVEMMIAQFYLDADRWDLALMHTESALAVAPEETQSQIQHSLNYIRHQS